MSSSWLVKQISEKTKLRSASSSYSLHSTSTATTSTSVASLCSSSPAGTGTGTGLTAGAMTDESSLSLEQWRKSDCSLDYWSVHLDGTGTPNPNYPNSNQVNVKLSDSNGNGTEEKKAKMKGDKDQDQLFDALIHDAPHLHVNLRPLPQEKEKWFSSTELPDWIDYAKLRDGRKFIHKHFFAIIFAHAVGLFLLVTVKPIQSLLLRTSSGIHARPEKAFTFFLKVFVQLVQWYKNMRYEVLEQENLDSKPIPDQNHRGTSFEAELSEIKTLIALINAKFKKFIPPLKNELQLTPKEEVMLKALKAELRSASPAEMKAVEPILVTMNPSLAFSQYHLAVIQYTFYGLVCRYPRMFGVHEKEGSRDRGLQGFRHVWAVLGHMLDLSDEFNFALQNNTSSEDKILSRVLLFSFSMIDETGLHMWRIISSGFTKYFMLMRTDVVIQFILQNLVNSQQASQPRTDCTESEEKGFWSNMSFTHKLYYLKYSFTLRFLLRCSLFRVTFNKLTAAMIRYANFFYRKNKKKRAGRENALDRGRSGSIFTLSRSLSSGNKGSEEVV